jgi:hypothetical protein
MDFEFERLEKDILEREKDVLYAKTQYGFLRNMRAVNLARLKNNYTGSEVSRDREARATKEYEAHLEMIKDAHIVYGEAKAELERAIRRYESYRSEMSYEKEKLKKGIY